VSRAGGPGAAGRPAALSAVPGPHRPVLNPQAELRSVMGQFATGITVLTAGGADAHAMTANSFTSVSLSPPLVLCCVARAARMHAAVLAAGSFGVSVLSVEQDATARWFADWRRPAGMAQFETVEHRIGSRTGAPLLAGSLAWLECSLTVAHDAGDHSIFIGEVLDCGRGDTAGALLFFAGGYHRLDPARHPATREKDAS
jgi:flavin reductase